MLTTDEDELITIAAQSDPDAFPFTDRQMSEMLPPCEGCAGDQSW
jgi:hypothetical protein